MATCRRLVSVCFLRRRLSGLCYRRGEDRAFLRAIQLPSGISVSRFRCSVRLLTSAFCARTCSLERHGIDGSFSRSSHIASQDSFGNDGITCPRIYDNPDLVRVSNVSATSGPNSVRHPERAAHSVERLLHDIAGACDQDAALQCRYDGGAGSLAKLSATLNDPPAGGFSPGPEI